MSPADADAPQTNRGAKPHDGHALSDAALHALRSIAARTTAPARVVVRAQALHALRDGSTRAAVAARLHRSERMIARWQGRWDAQGVRASWIGPAAAHRHAGAFRRQW